MWLVHIRIHKIISKLTIREVSFPIANICFFRYLMAQRIEALTLKLPSNIQYYFYKETTISNDVITL